MLGRGHESLVRLSSWSAGLSGPQSTHPYTKHTLIPTLTLNLGPLL